MPLGYCNVGRVIEVGPGITEFQVGDRVASNGPHAEIVCVPKHLCAKVPDEVSDEAAAFTVLSSIACKECGWCNRRWASRLSCSGPV
jgi:NADPH:quinone reductase-like Zn-dependent oxidoreductase